jgi:hypothetical protein
MTHADVVRNVQKALERCSRSLERSESILPHVDMSGAMIVHVDHDRNAAGAKHRSSLGQAASAHCAGAPPVIASGSGLDN